MGYKSTYATIFIAGNSVMFWLMAFFGQYIIPSFVWAQKVFLALYVPTVVRIRYQEFSFSTLHFISKILPPDFSKKLNIEKFQGNVSVINAHSTVCGGSTILGVDHFTRGFCMGVQYLYWGFFAMTLLACIAIGLELVGIIYLFYHDYTIRHKKTQKLLYLKHSTRCFIVSSILQLFALISVSMAIALFSSFPFLLDTTTYFIAYGRDPSYYYAWFAAVGGFIFSILPIYVNSVNKAMTERKFSEKQTDWLFAMQFQGSRVLSKTAGEISDESNESSDERYYD